MSRPRNYLIMLRTLSIMWLPYWSLTPVSANSSSFDLNWTATNPDSESTAVPQDPTTYLINELPELSDEEINAGLPLTTTTVTITTRRNPAVPWPWLIIFLQGNSSIAAQRQKDLSTYLRLNLAARLDADYNDVLVNRVAINHQGFLANISIEPNHLIGIGAVGLRDLSKGNVTLLQLSGQEYLVEKIVRSGEFFGQKIVDLDVSSVDAEVAIYGAVGAIFLFLFFVVLLGLMLHGPCKRSDKDVIVLQSDNQGEVTLSSSDHKPGPPTVIYTEELAKEMDGGYESLGASANRNSAKWNQCQSVELSQPLYAVPVKKKKTNNQRPSTLNDAADAGSVSHIQTSDKDVAILFQQMNTGEPNFYGI